MASPSTLSPDVLRVIGLSIQSWSQIQSFTSVCRSFNSALSATDLAIQDVQRLLALQKYITENQYEPCKKSRLIKRSGINGRQPMLIWAIKAGKDVDYIRQCTDVYLRHNCPDFFRGKWLPGDSWEYRHIHHFPDPTVKAVEAERLDVLQSFVECGIKIRSGSWHNQGPFGAACASRRIDIACWLITTCGVKPRRWHFETALQLADMQLLSTLLRSVATKPDRKGEESRLYALQVSFWGFGKQCDEEIILCLLDENPSVDRMHTFRMKIIGLLNFERYSLEWRCSRAIFLLKLWAKVASSPIQVDDILREAARYDAFLEVAKFILSADSCTIGQSDEERSEKMYQALNVAVRTRSDEFKKYLIGQGCKYSNVHLYQAILASDLNAAEDIINSGISVNCDFNFDRDLLRLNIQQDERYGHQSPHGLFETPLKLAIQMLRIGYAFLVACKLIHLGADFTNLTEDERSLVGKRIYLCAFEPSFRRHADSIENATKPNRLSFAQIKYDIDREFGLQKTPENMEALRLLAHLLLGDDYRELVSQFSDGDGVRRDW